GEERPVFRLRPRLNRTLAQSLHLVGNDEVKVEVDRIAESLAARARPIRIVEGKQPGLRLLIAQIAVLALEPLREAQCGCLGGAGAPARGFCFFFPYPWLQDCFRGLSVTP